MNDQRIDESTAWALLLTAVLMLLFASCTKTVYVPVERVKTVTTTVVDSFVEVVTPPERVTNTTTDTTSTISTRYATSTATVSNGILTHDLVQHARKDSVKTQTVYIHETDSVPFAVPYPVVEQYVPPWCWWLSILALICICVSLYIYYVCVKCKK